MPGSAGLRHRPGGRVHQHGAGGRRTGAVAGRPRPGHEPLRHRPGRQRGTLAAHRQPPPFDRGDGGGKAQRRAAFLLGPRPGRLLLRKRRERTGFRDFYAYLENETPEIAHLLRPFATGSLRDLLSDEGDDLLAHEALVTVFDLHLLEPELRPAAAMVCTETVWAAAAQDPRPRLLVVDEVWSIMQHPEGAAFMVSMAKRARKHRLGLQFITQDVQDLLSEDSSRTITGHSGRALLQNAAFKLLLQQDAAAVATVGEAFDLPEELQRWLLSCPRGDGLLLARGNRFPVRIEATPEETEVIEWRPGPRH